jgi:hypothetical protein
MFPRSHERLAAILHQALKLNKARASCFASIAIGAITAKTVLLSEIAACMPGKARLDSKFRRLQDFFCEVRPDFNAMAQLIMSMFTKIAGDGPLTLALDRTNWEARGNRTNLLMLSLCLGDAAQPLLWTDLRHNGNSDTEKRIRIIRRFLKLFGREKIRCLVADREFVGGKWFAWLKATNIPFVMRLRENFKTTLADGCCREAKAFFNGLRLNEYRDVGTCRVCGVTMGVCAVRTRVKEVLILGYLGMSGREAKDASMRRWNIETGFEKLKTHGFHLEESRLRGGGKMERLMAVLAISFAWCYAMGIWSVKKMAPIRLIKKLGRKARSVFARGMEVLSAMMHGSCHNLRQVTHIAFAFLRLAASVLVSAPT